MRKLTWFAVALAVAVAVIACSKLKGLKEGRDGPTMPPAEVPHADITGKYVGTGTNPDGSGYECEVEITKEGNVYKTVWYFDGKSGYEGRGILKGDTFVVGFGNAQGYGVVAYTVGSDGSLEGTWSGKGGTKVGTEKLRRR